MDYPEICVQSICANNIIKNRFNTDSTQKLISLFLLERCNELIINQIMANNAMANTAEYIHVWRTVMAGGLQQTQMYSVSSGLRIAPSFSPPIKKPNVEQIKETTHVQKSIVFFFQSSIVFYHFVEAKFFGFHLFWCVYFSDSPCKTDFFLIRCIFRFQKVRLSLFRAPEKEMGRFRINLAHNFLC